MPKRSNTLTAFLIASATLIVSILIPIIPCRKAPMVPNPKFNWAFCDLNPDKAKLISPIREYFGYTKSLTEAFFIVLLLAFIISFAALHYSTKRRRKGGD